MKRKCHQLFGVRQCQEHTFDVVQKPFQPAFKVLLTESFARTIEAAVTSS